MARKGKLKKQDSKEEIERPVRFRAYEYLFLIVCEDEKTEPSYFETFNAQIPEETLYLKTIGAGRDPLGVVKITIEERNLLAENSRREVDYVWAVFDKDDAEKYADRTLRFNAAVKIAERENILLAYSNEVFELWLLLYLSDVDHTTPLPRNDVYQKLQEEIRKVEKYKTFNYDHHHYDPSVVPIILEVGNLKSAIERAEILFEKQKHLHPLEANPSTKVHILVKELVRFIEYYNWSP